MTCQTTYESQNRLTFVTLSLRKSSTFFDRIRQESYERTENFDNRYTNVAGSSKGFPRRYEIFYYTGRLNFTI